MYESPKLVRFGTFRDLTLQSEPCVVGVPKPWTSKNAPTFDSFFPQGSTSDGCPVEARS